MTTTEARICSEEACDDLAALNAQGLSHHWCEHHLKERQRQEREENSPGWRTVWKALRMQLHATNTIPDACCYGKATKEKPVFRLSKWVGLGVFDYRAVQDGDGLYTIRRSKQGWGSTRDYVYWDWCQCGGWLHHEALDHGTSGTMKPALRTFASSASADRVAWRLQKGLPTYPDKLAIAAATLVIVATVVEATLEVVDLVD